MAQKQDDNKSIGYLFGLFESYKDGYLYGYTDNYMKVKVKGDEKLWGKQLPVELYSVEKDLILGSI